MSKELEMLREALYGLRHKTSVAFTVKELRRILARLEAAERVCEKASPVAEAPSCAWCGSPAFAYVSRFGGDQQGECCPACISMFGDDAKVTSNLAMPDIGALYDSLAAYRALDANETA